MKFQKTLTVALAVCGITFSSSAFAAGLVTDGNFDTPYGGATYTTYNSGDAFGPWSVTSGSVDLIGGYWQNPTDLTQSPPYGSVDLDGNAPGSITQSLLLNPGNYVLSFSLSGNPDGGNALKSMQAVAGSTSANFGFVTGSNTKSNMGYVTETMAFNVSGVGPQNVALSFLSLDESGPYGAVVGNVAVSAVPLPAGLPLFVVGLLGLGAFGVLRRRYSI